MTSIDRERIKIDGWVKSEHACCRADRMFYDECYGSSVGTCGGYLKDWSAFTIEEAGKVEHLIEITFYCDCTLIDHNPNWTDEIISEPFDDSCKVCGSPGLWPCCASCERHGLYF